jgi:hypothetical protein
MIPEPRLGESVSRFYERVPAAFARAHSVAGIDSDGHVVTVATSQPMVPSVFTAPRTNRSSRPEAAPRALLLARRFTCRWHYSVISRSR